MGWGRWVWGKRGGGGWGGRGWGGGWGRSHVEDASHACHQVSSHLCCHRFIIAGGPPGGVGGVGRSLVEDASHACQKVSSPPLHSHRIAGVREAEGGGGAELGGRNQ